MASISTDQKGNRTIQFTAADKRRRSIRLGKVPLKFTKTVKGHVEELAAAQITGNTVDPNTAQWLRGRDAVMLDKLAAVGLTPKRERQTLEAFIDAYTESRTDVKRSTKLIYKHTKQNLVEFFGKNKLIREITPGDADEWRLFMGAQKNLGDNTIRRRCGIAKQYFKAALRKKLISVNPFTDLKSVVRANNTRDYFITRKEAEKVLEACPDAQWRLLFALSRYGGLRCPSEHLGLTWDHIDWGKGRMTIPSPKTEHHPGGESRQIPIFPELRPYLDEVYHQAPPGTKHIITRYRSHKQNLRTELHRIITRAGLNPWPKAFQNLRATRETELAEQYPMHVVCAWIGNTQAVAMKHYLQVTDEHFEQGAGGKDALQNPVQQRSAKIHNKPQGPLSGVDSENGENSGNVLPCNVLRLDAASSGKLFGGNELCRVRPVGFEQDDVTALQSNELGNLKNSRAAESGAILGDDAIDADVAILTAVWPSLPASVKSEITRLVKNAIDD